MNTTGFVLILLISGYLIVMAVLGEKIGAMKGRKDEGMWFGLLLGPLGLLITALLPENKEQGNSPAITANTAAPKTVETKAAVSKPTVAKPKRDDDDDGTIPVYKL